MRKNVLNFRNARISGSTASRAALAGGQVFEGEIKRGIVAYNYIDTGATLNSTQARLVAEGEAQIGPTTEYAVYGEFGTRTQAARPFVRTGYENGKRTAVETVARVIEGVL